MIRIVSACVVLVLSSAWATALAQGGGEGAPPNVLLLIADDMGVDLVAAYGEHPVPAHTPVIDGLAAQGVMFRHAWANPVCSPGRTTMLTGRYSYRTDIGLAINYILSPIEVALHETSIAQLLQPTYSTAALGKWHLSALNIDGLQHTELMGFEHFRGTMDIFPGAYGNGYFDWNKITDGVVTHTTNYATTEIVDDALELIDSFGSDPWFLWVAFHAPHAPFHAPPQALHSYSLPPNVTDDVPLHARAMGEAMDTEIGRLLADIDPGVLANTIIVFVGDNGTDKLGTSAPFNPLHAKKTVFEGGVNVPLIITGPGIAQGAECGALVNTTDLFATVAELAGVPQTTGDDSVSLVPYLTQPGLLSLRDWVYTEMFQPNGQGPYVSLQRAVRNRRFKLIELHDNSVVPTSRLLFDLDADPFEANNLLDAPLDPVAQGHHDQLVGFLAANSVPWEGLPSGSPGTKGVPMLVGEGSLASPDAFSLSLSAARGDSLAALVIGASNISLPFSGGVFVPSPDALFFFLTDSVGTLHGSAAWPPGLSGLSVFFQYWVVDPVGAGGYASTNGLAAHVP